MNDGSSKTSISSEIANAREKRGECISCGQKCYVRSGIRNRNTPLTIENCVLNGRCLLCNPIPRPQNKNEDIMIQNNVPSLYGKEIALSEMDEQTCLTDDKYLFALDEDADTLQSEDTSSKYTLPSKFKYDSAKQSNLENVLPTLSDDDKSHESEEEFSMYSFPTKFKGDNDGEEQQTTHSSPSVWTAKKDADTQRTEEESFTSSNGAQGFVPTKQSKPAKSQETDEGYTMYTFPTKFKDDNADGAQSFLPIKEPKPVHALSGLSDGDESLETEEENTLYTFPTKFKDDNNEEAPQTAKVSHSVPTAETNAYTQPTNEESFKSSNGAQGYVPSAPKETFVWKTDQELRQEAEHASYNPRAKFPGHEVSVESTQKEKEEKVDHGVPLVVTHSLNDDSNPISFEKEPSHFIRRLFTSKKCIVASLLLLALAVAIGITVSSLKPTSGGDPDEGEGVNEIKSTDKETSISEVMSPTLLPNRSPALAPSPSPDANIFPPPQPFTASPTTGPLIKSMTDTMPPTMSTAAPTMHLPTNPTKNVVTPPNMHPTDTPTMYPTNTPTMYLIATPTMYSTSPPSKPFLSAPRTWSKVGQTLMGDEAGDMFGQTVAMSFDGNRIAVGADYSNKGGTNSGNLKVFDYNGTKWNKVGKTLVGKFPGDQFGHAVAMSAQGDRLAIGAYGSDAGGEDSGACSVFKFDGNDWKQWGSDITGGGAGVQFGHYVFMSPDGKLVAVGAEGKKGSSGENGLLKVYLHGGKHWLPIGESKGEGPGDNFGHAISISENYRVAVGAYDNDNDGGKDSGQVKVFDYKSGAGVQVGQTITGEAPDENLGKTIAITSDGTRIAVGAYDKSSNTSGKVKVFDLVGDRWEKVGDTILGVNDGDQFGRSLSMSADGSLIVVGAQKNDDGGTDSGEVKVFNFDGYQWKQIGQDLVGGGANSWFGRFVSVSGNGKRVAIAAVNDNEDDYGSVSVYEL